jgi:hypothetical protein
LPWRREALAAGSSSIISASHRGHWSNWSWDRIPPGYRVLTFE